MKSKILVIVPHEDDELSIAGQLIVSARKNGQEVYVLYTTNGDAYIGDGAVRIGEAIHSLEKLGVDKRHVIFLGYGNEYRGKHIYNQQENTLVCSRGGCSETYGTEEHPEYIYIKAGRHHSYTRHNLKKDLKNVITDIYPEFIISVDYDSHPDHKAASLFFEECMGEILKTERGYVPHVWKKFAYRGAWNGPKDYYSRKKTVNDNDYTDNPALLWNDRFCIAVDECCRTKYIRKNIIYQAALCHRTQNAWINVQRLCNEDVVYWRRSTNNAALQAEVYVTSGRGECLNDFVITDSTDITLRDVCLDQSKIWHPTDEIKSAVFVFHKPVDATKIIFYENPVKGNNIHNLKVEVNDDSIFYTGELKHDGAPSRYQLPCNKISKIEVTILDWSGELPGLLEVEIIDEDKDKIVLPEGIDIFDESKSTFTFRMTVGQRIEYIVLRAKAFWTTVLFPNYYYMRRKYPLLKQRKILLPIFWCYNWIKK